jgi:cobalamin synthase
MDFGEKVLYQQIHPAKLAANVGGSIVSTYLMRHRRFAWAMLAAFVPAVLASALVMRYADLERRKHSRFGRYMRRYMNRRVEAWVGAGYRVGKFVPIGWTIVVVAWACELWCKPTN